MKKLVFPLICLYAAVLFATDSRWRDGKIEFSHAEINGWECWTKTEKDEIVNRHKNSSFTLTVNDIIPSEIEINLSTCPLRHENYQSYMDSFTKKGMRPHIKELRRAIDESTDLPVSETVDLRQRLRWLLSYYNSLP